MTGIFLRSVPASQAKVNIGEKAQSVAFSPNGAHLAVGTITGMCKVRAALRGLGTTVPCRRPQLPPITPHGACHG